MNKQPLSPSDPLLTAFALGELEGSERARVEAAVQSDPALQAAVAEIRALASELTEVLATEPLPERAAPPVQSDREPLYRNRPPMRFPYWIASGLVAASFAVLVAVRDEESPVRGHAEFSLPEARSQVVASLLLDAPAEVAVGGAAASASAARPLLEQIRAERSADEAIPPVTFSASIASDPTGAPSASAPGSLPVRPAAAPSLAPSSYGGQPVRTNADGVVELSPFQVDASSDVGYYATNTLAGSRLNTKVGDLASSITVVTKQQAEDTGAIDIQDMFIRGEPAEETARARATSADLARRQALNLAASARTTVVVDSFVSASNAERMAQERRVQPPAPLPVEPPAFGQAPVTHDTETYAYNRDTPFTRVGDHPLSTFAVDVDTASYSNVRRFLQNGQRPPVDAVRIEELINYFPYRYEPPAAGVTAPFAARVEVASAPWTPEHRLVRIGIKGRELTAANRPAANLVFLVDISGSMNGPNRLPLVKESLRLLVGRLKQSDRVAIVTYAGQSGLALPSTPVSAKREILAAIDAMRPGGSTNGGTAIHLAYDMARANFVPGGLNRVIMCTDGDFNVGVTSQGELVRLVEEKAASGVFLTVLGYGMGNLKDATLESLANRGNGVYGYIDTVKEARKLLVEQVDGSLATIAKDVKIQVEFNPAKVASYRLIGYENRLLAKEDFNNDTVDAGEIGAGHAVTALYEIVPAGSGAAETGAAAPLRYQAAATDAAKSAGIDQALSQELLTVSLRYKEPEGAVSELIEIPFTDAGASFAGASADFQFASAVAGFGMLLRDSPHKGQVSYDQVLTWAQAGTQDDQEGYRAEFVELVRRARDLTQ